MQVAILGTGYVGLTTGVCLAYLGHDVTCLDVDENKINRLKAGEIPIYEPGLEELLLLVQDRLRFTTDPAEALTPAEVIFIAVGTPPLPSGSPDLTYVRGAAMAIGAHLERDFVVVVNKSTVPIGSGNWVASELREACQQRLSGNAAERYAVASNPEFLREGSALHDALYPDRVVIGSENRRALEVLYTLYRPLVEQSFQAPAFLPRPEGLGAVPLVATDIASAELIKYAANAFLALKISYINEIGQLAERVGADIRQVAKGIGLDQRIGLRFLQAGLGWGGSCFGKDTAALVHTAEEYGLSMPIVRAARTVNERQREMVVEKLQTELKILKGRTIGLLGLAFKPHTDDLREAPAIDLACRLQQRGARIRAHDPVALLRAKREMGNGTVSFCHNEAGVAENADALVLVTEWPQYRELPWRDLGSRMANRLLLDGRNFLDRGGIEQAGFRYVSIPG